MKVPVLMEFAATVLKLTTALVICTVLYIMQNCFVALLKILPFVGKNDRIKCLLLNAIYCTF